MLAKNTRHSEPSYITLQTGSLRTKTEPSDNASQIMQQMMTIHATRALPSSI